MNLQKWQVFDFSLGIQAATTWLLKKPNEIQRGINLKFTEEVGGIQRKDGNVVAGDPFSTVGNPALGGLVAKYTTGNVRFVAVNNDAGTACIIRTQNPTSGIWATLSGISYPVNSVIFFTYYLDEVYLSGFDPATGDPITPYNVDNTLNVSSTRNILYMPPGYFLCEYLGLLYMANVKLSGTRYQDRFYKSSPPLGYITTAQGAQTDVGITTTLIDQVPAMTSNTAPLGTVTVSSYYVTDPTRNGYAAFTDTPSSTEWITATNSTTGTLQYDFGSGNAKIITYYSITGVPSWDAVLARGPKTWILEGSNNGSTYTTIDAKTNVPAWAADEKRIYNINNTTAYRYYRLNVSANQGDTTYLAVNQMELLVSTNSSKDLQLKVDSVRYIKPGMVLDTYKAGTTTQTYGAITVTSVDKPNNLFTFTPYTLQFANTDVTTAADTITFTGNGTKFPTGTPIKFATNNTMPTGLTADTLYYSIYVDANTIKVATSLINAQTGVAIDITGQGTGPHYIRYSYVIADNDEIWLTGRNGKLSIFWNVDYPTPAVTGEWYALKPGTDSSNIISGISKSSNRLFIWGKNSGTRWDGQNLIVFNNAKGCISHRSIANIDDDWIIWLDSKGNIWARNESSGQQENISRPIRNQYLRKLTQTQLKAAAAGLSDNVYKLYLGAITDADGNSQNIRVCYDFDANTWTVERVVRPALMAATDDITGTVAPYFFSDNGKVYQDEIGNTDDGQVIPFEMGTGKDMLGTEQIKRFYGIKIFSENCSGLTIEAAVDGGQFKPVGQIDGRVCFVKFPETGDNALRKGVAIDIQIRGANEGDPEKVQGWVLYWTPEEDVPDERWKLDQ